MRGCALSVITPAYQASIQSTQTGIIIIKPYYRFLTIPAGPSRLPLCRHLRILYGLTISLSGLVVDILRLNRLLVYDVASKVALLALPRLLLIRIPRVVPSPGIGCYLSCRNKRYGRGYCLIRDPPLLLLYITMRSSIIYFMRPILVECRSRYGSLRYPDGCARHCIPGGRYAPSSR